MKDLTGQVAIITGASSGIGAAVARDLRQAGMKLVITARRGDRLQALAEELGETVAVAGDLVEVDMAERLLAEALATFGRCDVVLNNAGVMEVGTIEEVDLERISYMVRINVEATYRMAYVALKYFKSIDRGYLINISSILGTKVRTTAGAYAGTKFAIEAFTEALRMELGRTNVKIAALAPGLVESGLHDHWRVKPQQVLNIQNPLAPADIAQAIRWMLQQPDHIRIPRIMVIPGEQEL